MVYIYLCALGRSRPSMSMFLKSFLTLRICFQSFGQSSIKVGSMVQPIFWKIDSTFVSKFLSSTCRGIPAPSKHSLLEYWAFAQHWRSTVTILLQYLLFTRLVTTKLQISMMHCCFALKLVSTPNEVIYLASSKWRTKFCAKLILVKSMDYWPRKYRELPLFFFLYFFEL